MAAGACHSTVPSIRNGLDIEMPRSVLGSWVGVRRLSTIPFFEPRPVWFYPKILVLTTLGPRHAVGWSHLTFNLRTSIGFAREFGFDHMYDLQAAFSSVAFDNEAHRLGKSNQGNSIIPNGEFN